jgi:hypothetical protein
MINEALKMPEGDEKDLLIKLIANHMKKSYLSWNRDSVTDETILNDLLELSGRKLTIKEGLKLSEHKEFQKPKPQQAQSQSQQQRKRMQMQMQRKKSQ